MIPWKRPSSAFGYEAQANAYQATAIGGQARANSNGATALGVGAQANNTNTTAIGAGTTMVLGGVISLMAVSVIWWLVPGIRRYQYDHSNPFGQNKAG